MRTLTTLFIVLFVGLTGFGQTLVTLDGLILDRETKDPVPFANVLILLSRVTRVFSRSQASGRHFAKGAIPQLKPTRSLSKLSSL